MIKTGYTRCLYDCCIYLRKLNEGSYIYLLLYVDDILIAAQNKGEIEVLKKLLSSEFEMKDLGDAKKILGMEIYRDKVAGKLFLSQKTYIQKILQKFGMANSKPVSTPFVKSIRLSSDMSPRSEFEISSMKRVPYSNAVGSLMYAMVCTWPDIAYSVSVVSRFMSNPEVSERM